MNKKTKILMQVLGLTTILMASGAYAAPKKQETAGEILFKVHDVVPEKDADGKVLYCNIGATFFNRTKNDVSNVTLTLKWNDDVIEDIINLEERAEKEQKRQNSTAERSRYSTAGFTGKVVTTSLKLPSLKSNQQVSLKTKVDTERCFLLLDEMDITVNNCGTAGMGERLSRQSCENMFRYVGPKSADYYMEFKEISHDEKMAIEDDELEVIRKDLDKVVGETVDVIKQISVDASAAAAAAADK